MKMVKERTRAMSAVNDERRQELVKNNGMYKYSMPFYRVYKH
jgi:hypothetical protein